MDREAWRNLRASTPMSMTAAELTRLRGLADPIQLSEVEEIYLPLSRLLRLYYEASAALRETVGGFLGEQIRPAPVVGHDGRTACQLIGEGHPASLGPRAGTAIEQANVA